MSDDLNYLNWLRAENERLTAENHWLQQELDDAREGARSHEMDLNHEMSAMRDQLAALRAKLARYEHYSLTLTDRGDTAEGHHAVYADTWE